MARTVYLTTSDNPYDPSTDYINWMHWDEQHGYYTSQYLARIAITSDGFSDEDNDAAIERAIDEIIQYNLTGNPDVKFKKIIKEN